MEKLDEGLKTLLELGKRRGFLTFDQVNDYLPDEATSPEKIHGLLESLDEMGIELINEDEAESRLLASGDIDDEPDDDLVDEPVDDEEAELTTEDLDEISRRIDDPVRMYLTQMGEIPAHPRTGNQPGQEDRDHPQAVPPQGARMPLRPGPGRRRAQEGQRG